MSAHWKWNHLPTWASSWGCCHPHQAIKNKFWNVAHMQKACCNEHWASTHVKLSVTRLLSVSFSRPLLSLCVCVGAEEAAPPPCIYTERAVLLEMTLTTLWRLPAATHLIQTNGSSFRLITSRSLESGVLQQGGSWLPETRRVRNITISHFNIILHICCLWKAVHISGSHCIRVLFCVECQVLMDYSHAAAQQCDAVL